MHDHPDELEQDDPEKREQYRELLEELRTMIPGAQVLLAFLLTVPFSSRFEQVDQTGKIVFVVSLACSATATILFLAPAAYHRFSDNKDRGPRLQFGIRTAVVGLLLLGTAVALGIFVVVRFMFSDVLAAALAGSIAALALVVWVVVPVVHQMRSGSTSGLDRHR